jgi:hypothetical protein
MTWGCYPPGVHKAIIRELETISNSKKTQPQLLKE